MARRFVDDGGNDTTGLDWDNAYTSLKSLMDAEASFLTTAGNEVVFGADMQCQEAHVASLEPIGPTNGAPVNFISSTVYPGTSTVSYSKGTGNQIDTSESASYALTFNGAISLFGIKCKSGGHITLGGDNTERCINEDCTFLPGNNASVMGAASYSNRTILRDCTIDCTADSASSSANIFRVSNSAGIGGYFEIDNLTFSNVSNRTGSCIDPESGSGVITNCDFSGLPAGLDIIQASGKVEITNCILATGNTQWASYDATQKESSAEHLWTNCGTSNRSWWLGHASMSADGGPSYLESVSTVYRTGGAAYDGTPVAWYVQPDTTFGTPYNSPWMYGKFSSTGSKTVDVYIAQDGGSADLTDEEVWLEVQYPATAGSARWSTDTDRKTNYFSTAAAQTDDGDSSWTGITATYKQKLSVTVTAGIAGRFRCRVVAATDKPFYIDPKPVVS